MLLDIRWIVINSVRIFALGLLLGLAACAASDQTATAQRALRIHDGVIMSSSPAGSAFYRDEQRGLERLLLETAQPHIDPALHQTIRESLPEQ